VAARKDDAGPLHLEPVVHPPVGTPNESLVGSLANPLLTQLLSGAT
jgi:hypothetical protein